MSRVTFQPAAAYALDQLADLYTRMFADYAYPIHVDADWLAQRVTPEDIDLGRTPVICWDGEPVGLSIYARRGRQVNCGGFGIVPQLRGNGLAGRLLAAFIDQARRDGCAEITLMVLAENTPALRTYQRAGFRTTRLLDWYQGGVKSHVTLPASELSAAELLAEAAAVGLVEAAPYWQTADATLTRLPGLRAWALRRLGRLAAAAFVQPPTAAGTAHLHRLLATDRAAAAQVLYAVAGSWPQFSANEPDDSPWQAALSAVGLRVTRRRCDMLLTL